MKIFFFVLAALCLVQFNLCQNDTTVPITTTTSTTTSTTTITSTTTTTTTTTTTEPTTTTTPETTTTTPDTTTTTPETTTTTPETTTTTETTTTPRTTSPVPQGDVIFNFTVAKNSSSPCLRARFTLAFDFKYPATINGTKLNASAHIKVNSIDDYSGECNEAFDTLQIDLNSGWTLRMNYTIQDNAYELNLMRLLYKVSAELFPDVDPDYIGNKEVQGSNLKEFAANRGNSFKCVSETKIELGSVQVDFKNYQAQPFLPSDSKTSDFDTAIECAADLGGNSKLVPIIVGSALALLVILVLVAYIVGRKRQRPGYQSV